MLRNFIFVPPWNPIVNDLFGGLMIGEERAPSYGVMGTNLQAHQLPFRNVVPTTARPVYVQAFSGSGTSGCRTQMMVSY